MLIVFAAASVLPQSTPRRVHKQAFAGLQGQNTDFQCSVSSHEVFWMVNGSVYGLLQVPRDYVVCSEVCDLHTLTIPVAQREMDGYSFQCVGIDHATNTVSLGDEAVLNVTTLPQGLPHEVYAASRVSFCRAQQHARAEHLCDLHLHQEDLGPLSEPLRLQEVLERESDHHHNNNNSNHHHHHNNKKVFVKDSKLQATERGWCGYGAWQ